MPEYLSPGVYIEEIDRGPKPIVGVPTSTAAFVGETERGPLRPRLVTSFTDYQRYFGSVFRDGRFLPHAACGFFENGGKRLYVSRIVGKGATTASKIFGDFTVRAVGPGAWGRRVWVRIQEDSAARREDGFRMKLAYWATPPGVPYDPFDPKNDGIVPRPQLQEDFDDLSVDPLSADYFEKRLRDVYSALATIERTNAGATDRPPFNAEQGGFLDQDSIDDQNDLTAADFVGDPAGERLEPQGLRQLELDPYHEVALVHAPYPPANAASIAQAIIDHCERLRFRFAVVDCGPDGDPTDLDPRRDIRDTKYAAFYAPWLEVSEPETGARRLVPPGGHVLGVYARTDSERGVFKAPANEVVHGALDLRFDIDERHQGVMNPRGVNAIRRFQGRGIRVWGARTLSSDGLWKYVSLRRLFIFLEHSINRGTQWVVFEPNDERLWARVVDTVHSFLRAQWKLGALLGQTEDEAFFIACGRTTMSEDDIANGRLVCEIGIAPVRPGEFVIFRVFQSTAGGPPQEQVVADSPLLRGYRYRLEIAGVVWGGFSEVTIEGTAIEAVVRRQGADPSDDRKLPGQQKYGSIILERGLVVGEAGRDLFAWHADVSAGRRKVVIVVQDEAGKDAARFAVHGARPVRFDPSDLNAKGNELPIEVLELASEGIERVP